MSLYVYPSFDLSQIGSMTFTVIDAQQTYAVTMSTGVYSHADYSSVVSTVLPLPAALDTAITAAAVAAGSTITWTVAYDAATRKITFTPSSGTVKITFAGDAAGTVAKHVLGFSTDSSTLSAVTSDITVYYAIAADVGAQSEVAEYEPGDIADVAEGDDGSSAMVARSTSPVYYDCTIPYEPQAIVYTHHVVAANPWTWQMFFAHIRTGHHHFALVDSGTAETTVHRLRKDGVSFVPEPVAGDRAYQAYWNIPLRTYMIGRV